MMGSNKEQKKTNTIIDQERNRQQAESNQFTGYALPERMAEKQWSDKTREELMSGYRGFSTGESLMKPGEGGYGYSGGGGGGGGGWTPQIYNPLTASVERANVTNAKTERANVERFLAQERANAERANMSGYVGESADVARNLAKTGGEWDPRIRAGYSRLAETGGEFDPRIRTGYNNLADTGGYTPEDISNIRLRAASSSPAYFDAIRNRMAQRTAASGLNAGSIFSAASDRMARDAARQSAADKLGAELGLSESIRGGKLSGLSGLQGLEESIRTGKMAGLSGLSGLDTSMNQFRGMGMQGLLGAGQAENELNMFNTGQANAMNQFNAGQTNQIGMWNTGQANEMGRFNAGQANETNRFNAGQANQVGMFNAGQGNEMNRYNTDVLNQGSMYNIGNANSAAASAASAGAANARWQAEMDAEERRWRAQQQMAGLSGMESVWGGNPGELSRYDSMLMQNRFGTAGNIGDNINSRIANNPRQPSAWDRVMQGAGIVGGVAGAFAGA